MPSRLKSGPNFGFLSFFLSLTHWFSLIFQKIAAVDNV